MSSTGTRSAPASSSEILFENQAVFIENVDCMEVIPTSFRVKLDDVAQFRQITAALGCTRRDGGRR